MKKHYSILLAALLLGSLFYLSGCYHDPRAAFAAYGEDVGDDPASGVIPWTLYFDAAASFSSHGIIRYEWSFGDGDREEGKLVQHTYMHAGEYAVTLTVENSRGEIDTAHMEVDVSPAVWITDEALNRVYKLDMSGQVLDSFSTLPYIAPHGIAVGIANRETWIFVFCANSGNPRLLRFNPRTGDLESSRLGVSLNPLYLAYSNLGLSGQRLWHIDGFTNKLYLLDPITETIWDEYSAGRLAGVPPVVVDEPLLSDVQGLACTWDDGIPYLWYIEGSTQKLHRIKMELRGQGIGELVWDIQLSIELPSTIVADASVFPLGGMDVYDGEAWLVDRELHRIVLMDLETGDIVGIAIPNLPGSNTSGLEVQH